MSLLIAAPCGPCSVIPQVVAVQQATPRATISAAATRLPDGLHLPEALRARLCAAHRGPAQSGRRWTARTAQAILTRSPLSAMIVDLDSLVRAVGLKAA